MKQSNFQPGQSVDIKRGFSTRQGITRLIDEYKSFQLKSILSQRYPHVRVHEMNSRLSLIWAGVHDADKILEEIDRKAAEITRANGNISAYIDYSRAEIRALAISMAELEHTNTVDKVTLAEQMLGHRIPGTTYKSKLARTFSSKFWRRSLTVAIDRAREHAFLRLGKIGKEKEFYASDLSVDARLDQIRRQQLWMKNTVVVEKRGSNAESDDSLKEFPLYDVMKSPEQRFSKLYTFFSAMDKLATESKLSSAMLTITLEPVWHANPSVGSTSWNGRSPKEAHESFCDRWQAVLRDLHREGIRVSGFRVLEPHGDACPHYHTWLLYRPEHEKTILLTIMKYFKDKLKVRSSSKDGDGKGDIVYVDRSSLAAGKFESYKTGGAQVDFSRLEGDENSRVSYVMKYISKSLPGAAKVEDSEKTKSKNNIDRVDAFRAIWGMNQGQLFGVAKCLTAWDQLRALQRPPEHWFLRKLWCFARGGLFEGRIEKGSKLQGDAYEFLKALGGLDASRNGKRKVKCYGIRRFVKNDENRYGDKTTKTIGLTLVLKKTTKAKVKSSKTGLVRIVRRVIVLVIVNHQTKFTEWIFKRKMVESRRL